MGLIGGKAPIVMGTYLGFIDLFKLLLTLIFGGSGIVLTSLIAILVNIILPQE